MEQPLPQFAGPRIRDRRFRRSLRYEFQVRQVVIMNNCRDFFLNLVHRIDIVHEDQSVSVRTSAGERRYRTAEISYDLVSAQRNYHKTHDLQGSPRSGDARTHSRPAIVDEQCERGACKEPGEVRGVADKTPPQKTDEQVDKDDRQHARAKHALEPFRKVATILNSKNEENAYEPKQSSRSTRRRHIRALENETSQHAPSK